MRPHPDVDLLALHALGEPVLDDAAHQHVAGCARCAAVVAEPGGHRPHRARPRGAGPAARWRPSPCPRTCGRASPPSWVSTRPSGPRSVGPSSLRPRGRGDDRATCPRSPPARPGPDPPRPPTRRRPDRRPGGRPGHRRGSPAGPCPGPDRSARPRVVDLAARRPAGPGCACSPSPPPASSSARPAPRSSCPASRRRRRPRAGPVLAAADLEAFGAGEGTDVPARRASRPGRPTGPARPRPTTASSRCGSTSCPTPGDGFFEAWLIDPDTGAMVSLGPVPTGRPGEVTAELPVPRGPGRGRLRPGGRVRRAARRRPHALRASASSAAPSAPETAAGRRRDGAATRRPPGGEPGRGGPILVRMAARSRPGPPGRDDRGRRQPRRAGRHRRHRRPRAAHRLRARLPHLARVRARLVHARPSSRSWASTRPSSSATAR